MSPASPDVRRVVFDRDDHTCRRCGVEGRRDDLSCHRIGSSGRDGDAPSLEREGEHGTRDDEHGSAFVTVCADCLAVLEGRTAVPRTRRDLFETVRETIGTQGEVISDIAAFAALATTLTESLERGETRDYPAARRDVLLGIGIVDARLERLEGGVASDPTDEANDGENETSDDENKMSDDENKMSDDENEMSDDENEAIGSALEAFSETADQLQAELRQIVELAETAAEGHTRCRICFEPLESEMGPCPTCGGSRLEGSEWRDGDGDVRFAPLVSAINEGLRESAATTDALTERATRLAETLVD